MFKKSLSLTKNFYFITGATFFIWMLFFDTNDFYSQYQLSEKVEELENQETYYNQKIEEVNAANKPKIIPIFGFPAVFCSIDFIYSS